MCIDIFMLLACTDTSEILPRTQNIPNLKNYFHNTISHCGKFNGYDYFYLLLQCTWGPSIARIPVARNSL